MQLKAQCFGTKMVAYFNDLKDEESFNLYDEQKNFLRDFLPVWTTTRRKGIVQK